MSLGKIMAKAVSYVAKSGKTTAILRQAETNIASSIVRRVETNTAGRILSMQDAKRAFTPYATKVTKTNAPTQKFLDEMLEVGKTDALKATEGIYNRQAAADALEAFKNPPQVLKGGKLEVTSVPTQQYLDDMLGIGQVEALKTYEQGGRATRAIMDRRAAAREAFTFSGEKEFYNLIKKPTWNFDKLIKHNNAKFAINIKN